MEPNKLYAVLDLETTGGRPQDSRIMEIGIAISDGKKILAEHHWLLNPKRQIDYYVVKLTGINEKMVINQPTFAELADTIYELLDGKIIVAHNAEYDFQMLHREYMLLGKNLSNPKLCTVKLSKKLLPGQGAYNLKALADFFEIPLENAHRAMDDARATAFLLHKLLSLNNFRGIQGELRFQNDNLPIPDSWEIDRTLANSHLSSTLLFYNSQNELILVEAASNTQKTLEKILTSDKEKFKGIEMVTKVEIHQHLSWAKALLHSLNLIQNHRPIFSKPFKNSNYQAQLTIRKEPNGALSFSILSTTEPREEEFPYVNCTSKKLADKLKKKWIFNTLLHKTYAKRTQLKPENTKEIQHNNQMILDCFKEACFPIKNGYCIFQNINGTVEGVKINDFYIESWIKGTLTEKGAIEDEKILFTVNQNPKITRKFITVLANNSYQIIEKNSKNDNYVSNISQQQQ